MVTWSHSLKDLKLDRLMTLFGRLFQIRDDDVNPIPDHVWRSVSSLSDREEIDNAPNDRKRRSAAFSSRECSILALKVSASMQSLDEGRCSFILIKMHYGIRDLQNTHLKSYRYCVMRCYWGSRISWIIGPAIIDIQMPWQSCGNNDGSLSKSQSKRVCAEH